MTSSPSQQQMATRSDAADQAQRALRQGRISWRVGRWQGRFRIRELIASASAVIIVVACAVAGLLLGDVALTPTQVWEVILGGGSRVERLVVLEWRAPRALSAAVLGAALGIAGAVFQAMTRNPLASPDILGFVTGSYTGALVSIVLLGGGFYLTATGSIIGGLVTAFLVYVLAWRRGIDGFRLIVIGVAISAIAAAVNTYLLLVARLEDALVATAWGAGSLANIGWPQVGPAVLAVLVLCIALAGFGTRLAQLQLGDDAAKATGVRVEPTRLAIVIAAVGLTALATAVAGPIAFVSLCAPQIMRRVLGTAGETLAGGALGGAMMLSISDLITTALPAGLPVGVVTTCFGGGYLTYLLIKEARRHA